MVPKSTQNQVPARPPELEITVPGFLLGVAAGLFVAALMAAALDLCFT